MILSTIFENASSFIVLIYFSYINTIMRDIPKIEPIKLKEYEVKQRRFNNVPKIPFRSIILGPSGSGKQ